MKRKALKAAFPHTIPVMTGYLVLGISYGVLITSFGFPFWMPMVTSLTIFAGSMEFVLVNLLLSGFDLLQAFLMTLMINARHLFYGISMLDRYRGLGWKKFYMIFGLTDETYSLLCTTKTPEGVDEEKFLFAISIMNQSYWILGSAIGGIAGALIPFNSEGIDFAMTALFVVIFVEQWFDKKNRIPEIVGVSIAVICLLLFGTDGFVLPSMLIIILILLLSRSSLERQVNETCQ